MWPKVRERIQINLLVHVLMQNDTYFRGWTQEGKDRDQTDGKEEEGR